MTKTLTADAYSTTSSRPVSKPTATNTTTEPSRLVAQALPAGLTARLAALGLPALRERATTSWEKPATGERVFGFGEAARLSGDRNSTVAAIPGAVASLRARLEAPAGSGLRLFGGARFRTGGARRDPAWDAFGGWQFVLPAIQVRFDGERVSGSWVAPPGMTPERLLDRVLGEAPSQARRHEPVAALDPVAWKAAVAASVAEISRGAYEKSVLARRQALPLVTEARVGRTLTRLAERFPRCFVFKFSAGPQAWIGASPELLVSLDAGGVRAASVAGSQRGSTGDTLLGDPKELAEHAFVVTALRESLAPLCDQLECPDSPVVMSLPNISHLYTPFSGTPKPGVTILDLVEAVHPTPAVAGWPRVEAIEAIDRLEAMDRGWYAGPIGWLDFDGNGEFAVALRSGLVTRDMATLFAGAGIVAGSVPERELAETETKFGALRDAIGG